MIWNMCGLPSVWPESVMGTDYREAECLEPFSCSRSELGSREVQEQRPI